MDNSKNNNLFKKKKRILINILYFQGIGQTSLWQKFYYSSRFSIYLQK